VSTPLDVLSLIQGAPDHAVQPQPLSVVIVDVSDPPVEANEVFPDVVVKEQVAGSCKILMVRPETVTEPLRASNVRFGATT
jgi:hypothetical protein